MAVMQSSTTSTETTPLTAPDGRRAAVLHLTAEYAPYARTGGLGEAVAGLATYQHEQGVPVAVLMPLYRSVREEAPDLEPMGPAFPVTLGARTEEVRIFRVLGSTDGPPVYFLEHQGFFNRPALYAENGTDYPDNPVRFGFFAKAAVTALPHLVRTPAILHAHDWHTALAPVYLRTQMDGQSFAGDVSTVFSVHNPGYQGYYPRDVMPQLGLPWELFNWRQLEWYDQLNFLKGGLTFSEMVVTVSPTHADELRTPEGGFGLDGVFRWLGDRLVGIINGINQKIWDPRTDRQITARYGPDDLEGKRRCKTALQRSYGLPQRRRVPLFALTGRLVVQKGLDLILGAANLLHREAQFVFLGAGERRYEQALVDLAASAPDRIGVQLDFTSRLEHRLMAGADIFMMPSLYEPCGLTQMRAQRYGALPIGRRVGGLADTIEDDVSGFLFDDYTPEAFETAAFRALNAFADPESWRRMTGRAMGRDFGWSGPAARYREVYRRALGMAGMIRPSEPVIFRA